MLDYYFLERTRLSVRPRIYWKMPFVSGFKASAMSSSHKARIGLCLIGSPRLEIGLGVSIESFTVS